MVEMAQQEKANWRPGLWLDRTDAGLLVLAQSILIAALVIQGLGTFDAWFLAPVAVGVIFWAIFHRIKDRTLLAVAMRGNFEEARIEAKMAENIRSFYEKVDEVNKKARK